MTPASDPDGVDPIPVMLVKRHTFQEIRHHLSAGGQERSKKIETSEENLEKEGTLTRISDRSLFIVLSKRLWIKMWPSLLRFPPLERRCCRLHSQPILLAASPPWTSPSPHFLPLALFSFSFVFKFFSFQMITVLISTHGHIIGDVCDQTLMISAIKWHRLR